MSANEIAVILCAAITFIADGAAIGMVLSSAYIGKAIAIGAVGIVGMLYFMYGEAKVRE